MRLLVECTYVFEHPNDNSGIQRVVRNVIKHLDGLESDIDCIPVMMQGGRVYQVLSLAPLRPRRLPRISQLRVRLEHWRNRYWYLHSRFERLWPVSKSHTLRRILYVLCRVGSWCLTGPMRVLDRLNDETPAPERAVRLVPQAGDHLILLDSSWHADFFPLAERLKNQGVGIVSVVYDLIPLTHPQFCDAGLVRVFDRWFDWIAQTADGFISISGTISDQVQAEVSRRLGPEQAAARWFEHFQLGSDLDLAEAGKPLDKRLLRLFSGDRPVYLMVSTIEPRKNHAYLLDAFDLLWHTDANACLCIIGKVGWKCEALIDRINKHPQLNQRLFMFNQLDDAGLEYAYSRARALVFPSFVEGFGLPLVEGMQRGLPVMASNIPVFREIGGDVMAYFELDEPNSLARLVTEFESTDQFPANAPLATWSWLNWKASTEQFVNKIVSRIEEKPKILGEPD